MKAPVGHWLTWGGENDDADGGSRPSRNGRRWSGAGARRRHDQERRGFGEGAAPRRVLTSGRRRTPTTAAKRRRWLLASAWLLEVAELGRGEERRRSGANTRRRQDGRGRQWRRIPRQRQRRRPPTAMGCGGRGEQGHGEGSGRTKLGRAI
ncbi:hypothetical protein E2562_001199 [Oryza meyeriana var. granulata]|uniref:DUF834 domain-containing protein n=1 Tax=Oryza meyeriana var. granulata TaxID=110450 RepID=A0A6G1DDZ4_9ORYZ|nr:hypothetical protein E2562_001199 [Oryza meyeriana var. granulata]